MVERRATIRGAPSDRRAATAPRPIAPPAPREWGACPQADYVKTPRTKSTDPDDVHFCCWDQLDPNILNCDERAYIPADNSVRIGSFAAGMVSQTRADAPRPTMRTASAALHAGPTSIGSSSRFAATRRSPASTSTRRRATTPPGSRAPATPDSRRDRNVRRLRRDAPDRSGAVRAGVEQSRPDRPDGPASQRALRAGDRPDYYGPALSRAPDRETARTPTPAGSRCSTSPPSAATLADAHVSSLRSRARSPRTATGFVRRHVAQLPRRQARHEPRRSIATSRYQRRWSPGWARPPPADTADAGGDPRHRRVPERATRYNTPLAGAETRGIEFVDGPAPFVLQRTPPALVGFDGGDRHHRARDLLEPDVPLQVRRRRRRGRAACSSTASTSARSTSSTRSSRTW